MAKKTKGKSSPKNSKRGCLCPDGTYSTKCCDGSLLAQGIGQTTGTDVVVETESGGVRTITRN